MPRKLSRLMQSLLKSDFKSLQYPSWCPPADVYRHRQGWLVKLDLAGVRTEDIQLSVKGRHLNIKGFRRDFVQCEGQQSYSMEIAYNRFEKTIELPSDIETAQIVMDYYDGMLLIHLRMETE